MSRRWAIRVAAESDAPAMKAIDDAGFATYTEFAPGFRPAEEWQAQEAVRVARRLRDGEMWALLAESDGKPIAHVQIMPARDGDDLVPGLVHLRQLFVLPEWWGTGLATELLAAAIAEARRRGYERMRLFTPRDHARARRFYMREGFSATGLGRQGGEIPLSLVEMAIRL
jgi:GNAT superfamily N-acetyltransferase